MKDIKIKDAENNHHIKVCFLCVTKWRSNEDNTVGRYSGDLFTYPSVYKGQHKVYVYETKTQIISQYKGKT